MTFRKPVLLVLCALLALPLPAFSGISSPGGAAPTRPSGHVAIIGVPGLQWEDIDRRLTPNLWRLVDRGASASMTDRAVPGPAGQTCAAAGWLTISSGQRAGTEIVQCELVPFPQVSGDGAYVANFDEVQRFNAGSPYQAEVGLLGEEVRRSGGRTAAIGPGAAIGAADRRGWVDLYVEDPDDVADLSPYSLIVAEADAFVQTMVALAESPDGIPREFLEIDRETAAAAADRRVGRILNRLPSGATVLVGGVSDVTPNARLHTAIATGSGYQAGYLTSRSTLRSGLIVLPDLTSAALTSLGLTQPGAAGGRPPRSDGRREPPQEVAATLLDMDLAAQVRKHYIQTFYTWLAIAQAALYLAAAVILVPRIAGGLPWTRRVLRVTAVATASVPLAAYLMNLVPWWRTEPPAPGVMSALGAAIVAAILVAYAGPWRRSITGPLFAVAGATAAVLAADIMTGSHLQMYAFTGYEPTVAGRFNGFDNMGYSAFAVATLLTLAAITHPGGSRFRLALAAAVGAFAATVIGWPGWGTNFGGLISFVPGLAVCLLMLAGIRITFRRLVLVVAGAGTLVLTFAWLDWLRPPAARSHFGGFFANLVEGRALHVVVRKLDSMLSTLSNWQLVTITLVAVAFLVLVLLPPLVGGGISLMNQVYEAAPTLRPAIAGALTTAVTGFLVNDSGIAIPAAILTVVVPLMLASLLRLQDQERPCSARVPSARATSRN